MAVDSSNTVRSGSIAIMPAIATHCFCRRRAGEASGAHKLIPTTARRFVHPPAYLIRRDAKVFGAERYSSSTTVAT